jgi:hypothetical protein
MLRIKSYRYIHEAEIAKSVLESEGIGSFIDNENTATINWVYTAQDGIGLNVREEDAERALEILSPEETSPHPTRPEGVTKVIVAIGAIIILAVILISIIIGFK